MQRWWTVITTAFVLEHEYTEKCVRGDFGVIWRTSFIAISARNFGGPGELLVIECDFGMSKWM